jgi:hypothetical protein
VLKPDDYAEADLRAMIRGIGIGVAATVVLGGIVWFVGKNDSS